MMSVDNRSRFGSSIYNSSQLTYRNGSSGWNSGSSQYQAGGYGPGTPHYGYQKPDPRARAKEERSRRLARACGGPLTLTLATLFTLQVVLAILKGMVIWGLIVNIPNIFICIGLWIAFANGRSRRPGTAGLSLINGGIITKLVFWILFFSFVLILCFIGIAGTAFATSLFNIGGEIVVGPLMLAVICLVIMILGILYYAGLSSTASSLNGDIRTGRGQARVSMLSTVMLIFVAIMNLIRVFISFAWAKTITMIIDNGSDIISELYDSFNTDQLPAIARTLIELLIGVLAPTKAYLTIAHSVVSFITVILAIIICFVVRSQIQQDYVEGSDYY